ncbi:uncharacterized protein [Marmota flaviventris]|uniref:uncharacterized protein n=1 Tax=Marmota flaviventris TaxID=93162 RepID=UPI003A894880
MTGASHRAFPRGCEGGWEVGGGSGSPPPAVSAHAEPRGAEIPQEGSFWVRAPLPECAEKGSCFLEAPWSWGVGVWGGEGGKWRGRSRVPGEKGGAPAPWENSGDESWSARRGRLQPLVQARVPPNDMVEFIPGESMGQEAPSKAMEDSRGSIIGWTWSKDYDSSCDEEEPAGHIITITAMVHRENTESDSEDEKEEKRTRNLQTP